MHNRPKSAEKAWFNSILKIKETTTKVTSSSILEVTPSLAVSTEVQCFISANVVHFQFHVLQQRLGFDLDIEVELSEGLVGW